MKYYSQFGEDKWLYENGYIKANGFYLDIGAGHPTRLSNTALLRDLGWKGIQVDADSRWLDDWKDVAPLTVAIVSGWQRLSFTYADNPQASFVDPGGILVTGVPLAEITKNIPVIDLLSLDVEGHEYDVWNSGNIRPKIVILEYNTLGNIDTRLYTQLISNGYRLVHTTECNHILIDD